MSYTDMDCGIAEPHKHTGELVEGHFVEYWCPTISGWISKNSSSLYGNVCRCEKPHTRARVQTITTEIIDILEPEISIEEFIESEIMERFEYLFFYGEVAFKAKYGGS